MLACSVGCGDVDIAITVCVLLAQRLPCRGNRLDADEAGIGTGDVCTQSHCGGEPISCVEVADCEVALRSRPHRPQNVHNGARALARCSQCSAATVTP